MKWDNEKYINYIENQGCVNINKKLNEYFIDKAENIISIPGYYYIMLFLFNGI